ncbi:TBC1 domain family member 13 isoform X2 [Pteropus medius]|nr:TBC1 domain family member 13 isoform X2 [Pteropus giganteus]XP_039717647.1 TBC1 domain family member 13 isoform X2 [Pteropus giganteus]XP_039717648.1 TBC1 domain family member 13 isoform X2 [Pteropus giganteus]
MIIQPGIAKANMGVSREDVTFEDHPLNPNPDSRWNTYFRDNEVLLQIDKDVRRLYPDISFFQRATEYPCLLILDPQNEFETLRKRVEQTTLKSQTVARNRSGVTNMSSPHKSSVPTPLSEYEVPPSGCEAHWEVVERILFIYAKLNPGIAYVQGMNEIVGPLYYTFATDPDSEWKEHAEADTFFCFTNLMAEIRDNFIKSLDDSQCGITYKMEKVYSTLKDKDMELYLKLQEQNIKPQFFAFRWLMLLLSQEFLLPDVIRIWDSLFADDNRFDFLLLVCCAMLILIREQLLEGDFTTNMRLLQMSARSCRKPRSCKTQSSLSAGTQVWERSHPSLCPSLQEMQKPVGFQAKGKLQDWPPPPRPLPLCHAPSWPPSSGSFSTLQPWDPLPSLPSKAGTPEGIFLGLG